MQELIEQRVIISIAGDIWQPDATRKRGVTETASVLEYPDLKSLIKGYENRHGRCSSFTIEVTK